MVVDVLAETRPRSYVKMFETFARQFTQLDFFGGRYYDNVNDGFDGNNNATDSL